MIFFTSDEFIGEAKLINFRKSEIIRNKTRIIQDIIILKNKLLINEKHPII
jgi:hypothetical protein